MARPKQVTWGQVAHARLGLLGHLIHVGHMPRPQRVIWGQVAHAALGLPHLTHLR